MRDETERLKILKQTLGIDEELCGCFTDRQKAYDHVKHTKLMQILKVTAIDWHKR
jgi:hypothetical protein